MHQQQKIQLDISLAIRLRESSSRSYGGSCSYASAGAGHCNWAITITRVVNLLFAFSVSAFHILFWWCFCFRIFCLRQLFARPNKSWSALLLLLQSVFFLFSFLSLSQKCWQLVTHSVNFTYWGYDSEYVIEFRYSRFLSLLLMVSFTEFRIFGIFLWICYRTSILFYHTYRYSCLRYRII